jgi:hypothetical protein
MLLHSSFLLFENIRKVIVSTQQSIVRNVNAAMVYSYFQIGKMIVEDEQNDKQRANYAKETLLKLSIALHNEFGKGYSVSNLEYMRNFYLIYQNRISQSANRIENSKSFKSGRTLKLHLHS